MGERLEEALKVLNNPHIIDSELRELRSKAHEYQQDVVGLTPGQIHRLDEFDGLLHNTPLVTDFDREQSQALHPPIPQTGLE